MPNLLWVEGPGPSRSVPGAQLMASRNSSSAIILRSLACEFSDIPYTRHAHGQGTNSTMRRASGMRSVSSAISCTRAPASSASLTSTAPASGLFHFGAQGGLRASLGAALGAPTIPSPPHPSALPVRSFHHRPMLVTCQQISRLLPLLGNTHIQGWAPHRLQEMQRGTFNFCTTFGPCVTKLSRNFVHSASNETFVNNFRKSLS